MKVRKEEGTVLQRNKETIVQFPSKSGENKGTKSLTQGALSGRPLARGVTPT